MRLSATRNLIASDDVQIATNVANIATNTADITGGKGPGVTLISDTGATVDQVYNAFIAPAAGTITAVYVKLGTACGGTEVVDTDVLIAGVSCLTAAVNLAAADTTASKAATVDGAANTFAAGELITVDIDQTTGGADTAADLLITIAWRLT